MKYKIVDYEIVLISIALIILSLNRNSEKFGIADYGHDLLLLFVVFIVSLFVIFQYSSVLKITKIEITAFVLTIASLPSLLFSQYLSLYGFLQFAFIPLGLIFGQVVSKHITINKKNDNTLLILLLPAIITCLIFVIKHSQLDIVVKDFIFIVLIFLPYVLYLNKLSVKVIITILFIFVIILSNKRTAIISGIAFLFFFILIQFIKSNKLINKFKVLFSIVLITAIVGNYVLSEYSESTTNIIERFENIEDDGGSGRDIIYKRVLDGIKNAKIENLFWGYGYNAVSNKLFGHPAHNDFLEIIYDNGLFVFVLYILLLYQIILYCYKHRHRKEYYLSMMSCIVNYLIIAFVNCIITNPLFVYVIMTSIGMSIEYLKIPQILANERIS